MANYFIFQMTDAISGISEYNKELVAKYYKEMKLRKKYHNELVELKGIDVDVTLRCKMEEKEMPMLIVCK